MARWIGNEKNKCMRQLSVDKFLSWRMIVLLEKVGVKASHNIALLSLEMRERISLNLSRNKAVL